MQSMTVIAARAEAVTGEKLMVMNNVTLNLTVDAMQEKALEN